MKIELKRSDVYIPLWCDNQKQAENEQIKVHYKYLTAEDRSKFLIQNASNFAETARLVFLNNVTKIDNLDLKIDGKKVESTPENILQAPDMYSFFSEVAAHIIQASQLPELTKKKS